jgi:hypothetical protein
VVIDDGSSSKTDEVKNNPKWLIRGYSKSKILDRNFEKRVIRSQCCIVKFSLMTKVMKIDESYIYTEA